MVHFLIAAALADEPAPAERDIEIAPAAPESELEVRLSPEERKKEATKLYAKALEAWRDSKRERAWRLATEALVLDPDLTPARLLLGYSLLRMRKFDEGATTIEGLSLEPGASPLPPERRTEARRLARRKLLPYTRHQWWLSVGSLSMIQRYGADLVPINGYVFGLQAPLVANVGVRVDGAAPWPGTADDLDVRGPRFDVLAVAEAPIHRGVWHVDVAAGPAFWIAEGRYWPDSWEPYFGVRGAVGTDVRLGPAVGLRYEVGTSVFPTAVTDLPWYAAPVDLRISFQGFFGR